MKKFTLIVLGALFFVQLSQAQVSGRKLRFSPKSNGGSSVNYDIQNTNNANTFLNSSNWLIVDGSGAVTTTTAAPNNYDTLQMFDLSVTLNTDFDMYALENIVLDFGNPKPGLAYSLLIKRDKTWFLHPTTQINVRSGQLQAELDNNGLMDTRLLIGSTTKILGSPVQIARVLGPSSASSATPESISQLQEGFVAGLLPVIFAGFDVVRKGSSIQLQWSTEQEFNTRSFAVERSTDGKNYASVALLQAAGTSTTARSYSYSDATPATGVVYYRIRMTSLDDINTYTTIRAVRPAAASATRLTIYPNPASRLANLIVSNGETRAFTVNVFNRYGQLITSQKVGGGTNVVALDVSAWSAGDYSVDVHFADGSRQTSKIIITR